MKSRKKNDDKGKYKKQENKTVMKTKMKTGQLRQ